MKKRINTLLIFSIILLASWSVSAQTTYVGTNYHPNDDKNQEKIKKDIMLMKAAGFKVVRMGHLAWDSYEPAEDFFIIDKTKWQLSGRL